MAYRILFTVITMYLNNRYDALRFTRETNLKVRQALTETASMADDIEQLAAFHGNFYQIEVQFSTLHIPLSPTVFIVRAHFNERVS